MAGHPTGHTLSETTTHHHLMTTRALTTMHFHMRMHLHLHVRMHKYSAPVHLQQCVVHI